MYNDGGDVGDECTITVVTSVVMMFMMLLIITYCPMGNYRMMLVIKGWFAEVKGKGINKMMVFGNLSSSLL